eukprot:scaffold1822_cov221-Alexandrium_tamarense.AAC.23
MGMINVGAWAYGMVPSTVDRRACLTLEVCRSGPTIVYPQQYATHNGVHDPPTPLSFHLHSTCSDCNEKKSPPNSHLPRTLLLVSIRAV